MEDLIPLIIGVLWLLYTFYSRGQKKKARKEPSSADKTQKKPTFLEQLLAAEDFQFEADDRDEPLEADSYEPYEDLEPAPVYRDARKERNPFLNAELSNFVEEGQLQFREAPTDEEDDEISGLFPLYEQWTEMHDFDLRKAVVYSTILEAPYIDYK